MDSRCAFLGARQFLTRCRQQLRQIALHCRLGAQVLNRIPAFGDCACSAMVMASSRVRTASSGRRESRLRAACIPEQRTMKALQQRVVQFAGDARALADALFQARVEFLRDLMQAVAIQRPEQCQKSGHARRRNQVV